MTEKDIIYEVGGFWVSKEKMGYMVWRPSPSGTHSVSDSAFHPNASGLTLAQARVDYLARRDTKNEAGISYGGLDDR